MIHVNYLLIGLAAVAIMLSFVGLIAAAIIGYWWAVVAVFLAVSYAIGHALHDVDDI